MTIASSVIGCDISKDNIELFEAATGRCLRIDNTDEALDRLLPPYAGQDVRFAFEATGAYGRTLRQALGRHGCVGVQVNPLHGRRFAQSLGRLAKTDRVDARQLAIMVDRLKLPATQPWQPELETLKSLIARRDQLVKMRADERRRQAQCPSGPIRDDIEEHIAYLTRKADTLHRAIREHIANTPDLARRDDLLQSIPGIGPQAAAVLIALLPELGQTNRLAIAALAGVAPMARDSGQFNGKRSIAGGRPRVRQALFNAAFSASRTKSRFGHKHKQLTESGKPPKVARIAVARKILITANAMIKTNTPFNAE